MGRVEVEVSRRLPHRPEPHEHALLDDRFPLPARTERDFADLVLAAPGPTVADLFCGAGGMSLGLEEAGFTTVLGVDSDPDALETHRAHFGGLHLNWDLHDQDRVTYLGELLGRNRVDLLVGGPPCQPFSRAGRSLIRDLVQRGLRQEQDVRRDLWESFLTVALIAEPRAVLMENVPGMATERDMEIVRLMADRLERGGYSVSTRVVQAKALGVPQHRERLILVALRGTRRFVFPEAPRSRDAATVWAAIGDLPAVEPGWAPPSVDDDGRAVYDETRPRSRLATRLREGAPTGSIHDHFTRAVREDDLAAFAVMDSQTRYDQLDDDHKRYRDDIFTDKYKRLAGDEPSRTITAHLARDGYWYIHPREDRTLTVREAARLQTFPDRYRFAGPPTAMFRQIGNAVPPAMARALGVALQEQWSTPGPDREVSPAYVLAERLASWFNRETSDRSGYGGWLNTDSRWAVLLGELLLSRVEPRAAAIAWRALDHIAWTPQETVENASQLKGLLTEFGDDGTRCDEILGLAQKVVDDPELLFRPNRLSSLGLPPGVIDVAILACPGPDEDPILSTTATRRVSGRILGMDASRRAFTDGRLNVASVVSVDDPDRPESVGTSRMAQLALMVLGRSLCGPAVPNCLSCPLSEDCSSSGYGR